MNNEDKIKLEYRIKDLEENLADTLKRLEIAEKRLMYYDKMALKAGFFSMGFLCFGAALSMGFDKLKDKIISLILP